MIRIISISRLETIFRTAAHRRRGSLKSSPSLHERKPHCLCVSRRILLAKEQLLEGGSIAGPVGNYTLILESEGTKSPLPRSGLTFDCN